MRSLAIFGPGADAIWPILTLEGTAVPCAVVSVSDPIFDPQHPTQASQVLVRKRGFSVNYRDRARVLRIALTGRRGSFDTVGSDFVADVVAVGSRVTSLAPGDRVIGNAAYPESGAPGVPGGIPGNRASEEFQILDEVKLAKIPTSIPDEVAACFTVGAQTSFSLIRKLALGAGDHVLVTAATSNTSLFVINRLRRLPVRIYATTTTPQHVDRLRALGVAEVLLLQRGELSFREQHSIRQLTAERGGFDAVIDPFFDLYLSSVINLIRPGGCYITCGFFDQHTHLAHPKPLSGSLAAVMKRAMLMNLQIYGNCLGETDDLRAAIAAYEAGEFDVVVDSVFVHPGCDPAAFLTRSYNATDRFGKVPFLYA